MLIHLDPSGLSEPRVRYSSSNVKVEKAGVPVAIFNLPSGHSCPGARACLAKVDFDTGTILDGPEQEYRCFHASLEAARPALAALLRHNLTVLTRHGRTPRGMFRLLFDALPPGVEVVRVHAGGDFFSQAYFDAWMMMAESLPHVRFYAYTKSLPFWVARLNTLDPDTGEVKGIPDNFKLTASVGGRYDQLIERYNLRSATVVWSEEEAAALGLEVDHDDSHAREDGPSFSLMIHGAQPPGKRLQKALTGAK